MKLTPRQAYYIERSLRRYYVSYPTGADRDNLHERITGYKRSTNNYIVFVHADCEEELRELIIISDRAKGYGTARDPHTGEYL